MNNSPSAPRLALAGLLALACAMGIGRFAFTPVLPLMQEDHGLSLSAAGWLAAANYLGYLVGAALAMRLRSSEGTIVRGALLAIAVATAAMGFLPHLWAWLPLRFIAGVASAWALVYASTRILHGLAEHGRPALGSVLFAGVGFGTLLAGLCCLAFLHLSWSADASWAALGLVALLLAAASWPAFADAPPRRHGGEEQSRLQPRGATLRHWKLVSSYGLFGFGYIIPATFLPAMARQALPDPAVFGWAWPIFGFAALVSTLLSGLVPPAFSRRALLAISQSVMALGVAVPLVVPGLAGIVIAALCVGGTFVVLTLAAMQEARRVEPLHSAQLIASMTTAFAFGQILGPVAVALVGNDGARLNALLAIASASLAAGALMLSAPAVDACAARRRATCGDSRSS